MTANHRSGAPVWRRPLFWVPIVVAGLAGLMLGLMQSMTSDPGYEAVGTLFVGFEFPPDTEDPFSAAQFVTQRIDTYAELGQSAEVLRRVGDEVGGLSDADLSSRVTVVAVPGSVLLRVTARDGDATTAATLVDTTMTELDAAVSEMESGANISPITLVPVQPALVGPASSLVSTVIFTGGGLLAGGLLGALVGGVLARARRPASPPQVIAAPGVAGGRHRCTTAAPRSASPGESHAPKLADSVT